MDYFTIQSQLHGDRASHCMLGALVFSQKINCRRSKVPGAYSGHPIYSVLQGIQLELQSGRTRFDKPSSVFVRAASICKHILCDVGSASCSGIDASMQ